MWMYASLCCNSATGLAASNILAQCSPLPFAHCCISVGTLGRDPETTGSILRLSAGVSMAVKAGEFVPHRLISIGPSHYCEKARWALERAHIPFSEDKHCPGFHIPATKGFPGGKTCPKLVIGKGPEQVVLSDSHDILEYADTKIDDVEDRLYPSDSERLQLVRTWESKFDERLGPHVRRYAYSFLLFESSTFKLLTQGGSTFEKVLAWIMLPLLRRAIYRGLKCNRPGAKEQSLEIIENIFKEVDNALADGRAYICGSEFSAADVTFAALGGPLVTPPESEAWMPPLDTIPSEMRDAMKRLTETPAGQHILKIYRTRRQRPEQKRVY